MSSILKLGSIIFLLSVGFGELFADGSGLPTENSATGMAVEIPKQLIGEIPPQKVKFKSDWVDPKSQKTRPISYSILKKMDAGTTGSLWLSVPAKLKIFDYGSLSDAYREGKSATLLARPDSACFELYTDYQRQKTPLMNLWVRGPLLDSCCGWDGLGLTEPIAPGAEVLLRGRFFGATPPKVWLEYAKNPAHIKKAVCLPRKPYLLPNPYGVEQKQPMNSFTGESAMIVRFPARWPSGFAHGDSVVMVIDNGCSIDSLLVSTAAVPTDSALKIPDPNRILDQAIWDDAKGSVMIPVLTARDADGKALVRDESGALLTLKSPRSSVPGVAEYKISKGTLTVTFNANSGAVTTNIYVMVYDARSKRQKELRFRLKSNRKEKYPNAMRKLRQDISELRAVTGSAGIFVALCEGDNYLMTEGNGTLGVRDSRALTDETLFGMGSISELFTSSAAMYLHQLGKLNINTKITKYLPNFEMGADLFVDKKRSEKLTSAMLMSHTSGLVGSYGPLSETRKFVGDRYDALAYDNLLKARLLSYDPGEIAVHSPDNAILLENVLNGVVQKRYKKTYEKYFLENFCLKQTRMRNTLIPKEDLTFSREIARAHLHTDSSRDLSQLFCNGSGARAYYSTPVDLCQLGKAYMPTAAKTGEIFGFKYTISSFKGLLKKKQVKLTEKNWAVEETKFHPINALDKRNGYGLGWDAACSPVFDHLGTFASVKRGVNSDYASVLVMYRPHKTSVAISMTAPHDIETLEAIAERYLVNVLIEKKAIKEEDKKLEKLTRERALLPTVSNEKWTLHTGMFANSDALYQLTKIDKSMVISRWAGTGWVTVDTMFFRAKSDRLAPARLDSPEYYAKKVNNDRYLIQHTIDKAKEISENHAIFAQALPELKPDLAALQAWKNREGRTWMISNDHYLGTVSNGAQTFFTVRTQDLPVGYVALHSADKMLILSVSGPQTLVPNLKIPGKFGANFRPVLIFSNYDTLEWLRIGEFLARPVNDFNVLPKHSNTYSIEDNLMDIGLKIPDDTQTVNITRITSPDHRWVIYDKHFNRIIDSRSRPSVPPPYAETVTDPRIAGGYLVLKGESARISFTVSGQ